MAVAVKAHTTNTTNEATTISPVALRFSINLSNNGAALRLKPMAARTNTTAAATREMIGPIVSEPLLARLTTTARITIPRMSSRTAAPRTICPSDERSILSSPNTLAVIAMLVAVIDAPANTAGIKSTWKIAISPAVPTANGNTTPAMATEVALPPTATSSSRSLSRPVRKSKEKSPRLATASTLGKVSAYSSPTTSPGT